ncbi:MAG TPA: hypothetical protein VKA16_09710 [Burkholderiales bacterium]|nr:hypothetical protein [Burkholderiales bacterium]
MSAVVGLAMMFAAILIGRAAKIGIPMQPPPWWASDEISALAIAPAIVSLFAAGLASIGSWLLRGDWRASNVFVVLGLTAVVAGYVALARAIKAWALRVSPPSAEVVQLSPAAADNDPRQPPRMPPMKKAA